MIDTGVLVLAFGAGMVATFNPCGFAMLPAYVSYFLGLEDAEPGTETSFSRAIAVGGTMTAGFLVVFAVIGMVIETLSLPIQRYLPWVTIVLGFGLVVLGIRMLRGSYITLNLPVFRKGATGKELSSIFVFGISYALVSLSCTITVFLAVMSTSFTQTSWLAGVLAFVTYGLGMGLVLVVLTAAIALARTSVVKHLKHAVRYVNRAAAVLLLIAGAYVIYYGWYEIRVQGGQMGGGGAAQAIFDLNQNMSSWVERTGATRIGLVLAGILAAMTILAVGMRRAREPGTSQGGGGGGTTR